MLTAEFLSHLVSGGRACRLPRRTPVNITLFRSRALPFLLTAMLGALALPSFGQPEGKKGEAKKEEPKGRKYALVVGVRHYKKDELRPLKYADKDAAALAAALRAAGYRRVVLM